MNHRISIPTALTVGSALSVFSVLALADPPANDLVLSPIAHQHIEIGADLQVLFPRVTGKVDFDATKSECALVQGSKRAAGKWEGSAFCRITAGALKNAKLGPGAAELKVHKFIAGDFAPALDEPVQIDPTGNFRPSSSGGLGFRCGEVRSLTVGKTTVSLLLTMDDPGDDQHRPRIDLGRLSVQLAGGNFDETVAIPEDALANVDQSGLRDREKNMLAAIANGLHVSGKIYKTNADVKIEAGSAKCNASFLASSYSAAAATCGGKATDNMRGLQADDSACTANGDCCSGRCSAHVCK